VPKQTFLNLPKEKREHIMKLAVKGFADFGYEKFSISRLVTDAGIAKGSFYQYFEDKDDLYEHVLDRLFEEQKKLLTDDQKQRLMQLNLTQFIRALYHSLADQMLSREYYIKIMLDYDRHSNHQLKKRLEEKHKDDELDYYMAVILDEKSRLEIDPKVDGETLGHMLWGINAQINRRIAEEGIEIFTPGLVDDLVDKLEYILTNGIYTNTIPEGTKR